MRPSGDRLRALRTSGFKPLRVGKIHLRCPGCGRKYSNTPRTEDDPPGAFLGEACCPKCCVGHKDCGVDYFDAKGEPVYDDFN